MLLLRFDEQPRASRVQTFFAIENPDELLELGQIIGAADRIRLLHQQSYHEMMSEIRWTEEEEKSSRDGLGIATLELSATDRAFFTSFETDLCLT